MSAGRGWAWLNFATLICVNLLWAAQYPAYKIAGDQMEPATLNFWTLLFASALLFPFWIRERKRCARPSTFSKKRTIGEFVLIGTFGMIPPSVLLAWGISHSSASNAAILSLTIPILMTAMAIAMLGEKLTVLRALSLVLGLFGTLLLSTSDLAQFSLNRSLLLGNAAIACAWLGSAFYNTYSKKLLEKYSELDVLLYSYLVAIVECAAISIFVEAKPFYVVSGYLRSVWVAVFVLGALSWGIAMVLWMWVLHRLEVGQVSSSFYLLPLFGLILSVFTVHERVSGMQLTGGALTVVGTALLTFFEGRGSARQAENDAAHSLEKTG